MILDELKILFGGGETLVASEFADDNERSATHQVMGDESVAKVIDLGVFDTSESEVAVDSGTNVADEQWAAGLGDEELGLLGIGAHF